VGKQQRSGQHTQQHTLPCWYCCKRSCCCLY
jgi:hypothetical protein